MTRSLQSGHPVKPFSQAIQGEPQPDRLVVLNQSGVRVNILSDRVPPNGGKPAWPNRAARDLINERRRSFQGLASLRTYPPWEPEVAAFVTV